MTSKEKQQEALSRAQGGLIPTVTNYSTIYREFAERGIPPDEIVPRLTVLTYQAWRALGRHVRKGEHGVSVLTFVPMQKEDKEKDGTVKMHSFTRPRSTSVFHISQTDPDES
jgi:hypothetical protein